LRGERLTEEHSTCVLRLPAISHAAAPRDASHPLLRKAYCDQDAFACASQIGPLARLHQS
jgi:hypothetical protein